MKEISSHAFRYLTAAAVFILSFGTVFYHFEEKLSWINAYYFSVITLTTVGYGDITPHTDVGKIFTTLYIFAGVGIITTFFSALIRRRAGRIEERHQNSIDGTSKKL